MKPQFEEYSPKKIVNRHKHVDGPWFWTRYSAKPYVGCAAGCPFCYLRSGVYLGKRDPRTFDTLIQVKRNAPDLLRKELPLLPKDIIMCGDWQQPAERKYKLSRRMLMVVWEQAFPLFALERSTLLTRDLDLLTAIDERSWAGVAFSLVGVDDRLRNAFEFRCPSIRARLKAMETIARAGLTVGTVLMPVIPFLADSESQLEAVVQATRDHGGSFVLAGGLTMGGAQSELTLRAALDVDPAVEAPFRELYQWKPGGTPSPQPPAAHVAKLGRRVRELCARHGIADRMSRYVAPGPLSINKKIAERLFLRAYDLELENAHPSRIWPYRKAAWMIDDWPESLEEILRSRGEAGLRELPNIGAGLAGHIQRWLPQASTGSPSPQADTGAAPSAPAIG
jgi:DNA repair photolyase